MTAGQLRRPVESDLSWQERAACTAPDVDAEWFFHEGTGGSKDGPARGWDAKTTAAKATCERCPVQTECLEDAMADASRVGVWGGLTERERRALRREA